MTNDKKKYLIRFLKELGCYNAYKMNYNPRQHIFMRYENGVIIKEKVKGLNDFLNRVSFLEAINYAFSWTETKQTFAFWCNVDNIWRQLLSKRYILFDKRGNIENAANYAKSLGDNIYEEECVPFNAPF